VFYLSEFVVRLEDDTSLTGDISGVYSHCSHVKLGILLIIICVIYLFYFMPTEVIKNKVCDRGKLL